MYVVEVSKMDANFHVQLVTGVWMIFIFIFIMIIIIWAGSYRVKKWFRFRFHLANFALWMLIGSRPDDTFFVVSRTV